MPVILRLIAAGVPAAKIIAKYGKKAYNTAKLEWKGLKRLLNLEEYPVKTYGLKFKGKPAKIRGKEFEQKKGGKIKTYAKGSKVRKPKY